MKFKFFDHTADAKFQAYGRSLEEAFSHAALATASLMWNYDSVEDKICQPLRIKGIDLKQLLVKFLEEVLFLWDTRKFLLKSAKVIRIDKNGDLYKLEAQFFGDYFSKKYKIFGEAKAITYNEMRIENNDHFMVQVVVDI